MLLAFVNIFYGFLYYNKFPAIEKNKSNGLPWPWEENSKKFWDHFPTVIWTYLSNLLIFFPLLVNIAMSFYDIRTDLESMPSFWETWIQTWLSFVIEDFLFYWVHRIIHHPKLYWIHKKHHKFYNTFHLACVYTHPIEFIAGVAFPLLAGSMIFKT